MRIFHKLAEVPPDFGPTIVTVGNFDGVHHAHSHVLQEIVARARQQNAKAVAISFEPHPMRILRPEEVKEFPKDAFERELTPEELKEAYRLAREAFTAADLQKFTEIEEELPAEEVIAEMEKDQAEWDKRRHE